MVENQPASGDAVQSLGQRRSPGVGNGTHSTVLALENPLIRGACWATVTGLQSWMQLCGRAQLQVTCVGSCVFLLGM